MNIYLLATGEVAGECFCRAVRYAVVDSFEYALNCHCSNCRRATGSAFKLFAGIGRDQLRITRGREGLTIFGSETGPHDVHCATCGSLLFSVVREATYVHVTLGTLIDEPTIRPSMHIYVGSKAKWHEITDELPQHSLPI
ncbi:GFA family protein [Mesorhizobium sp. BHbsci]